MEMQWIGGCYLNISEIIALQSVKNTACSTFILYMSTNLVSVLALVKAVSLAGACVEKAVWDEVEAVFWVEAWVFVDLLIKCQSSKVKKSCLVCTLVV